MKKKIVNSVVFGILFLAILPTGQMYAAEVNDGKIKDNERLEQLLKQNEKVEESVVISAHGFVVDNTDILTAQDILKRSDVKATKDNQIVNVDVNEQDLNTVNSIDSVGGYTSVHLTVQDTNIDYEIFVVKKGSSVGANEKGAIVVDSNLFDTNDFIEYRDNNQLEEKTLELLKPKFIDYANNKIETNGFSITNDNDQSTISKNGVSVTVNVVDMPSIDPRCPVRDDGSLYNMLQREIKLSDPQATGISNANAYLAQTKSSATVMHVSDQDQLQAIFNDRNTPNNTVIYVDNDFTISKQIEIKSMNNQKTFTFTGNNPTVNVVKTTGRATFNLYAEGVVLNFDNITISGTLPAGAAKNGGYKNQEPLNYGFIRLAYHSNAINTFDNFTFKNYQAVRTNAANAAFVYGDAGTCENHVNLVGGTFENNAAASALVRFYDGSANLIRLYNPTIQNNISLCDALIAIDRGSNRNYIALLGGKIVDNYNNGSWYNVRGVTNPLNHVDKQYNYYTGTMEIHNNKVVDLESNQELYDSNLAQMWEPNENMNNAAPKRALNNLTPDSKLSVGVARGYAGQAGDLDTVYAKRVDNTNSMYAKYAGVPLAQLTYSNAQYASQYQYDGIAQGLSNDWEKGYSGNGTITDNGGYKVVEKRVDQGSFAVLTKAYSDVNLVVMNGSNQLSANTYTIPNIEDAKLPFTTPEGYNVKRIYVKSNTGSGLGHDGSQPELQLADNKIGLNPNNSEKTPTSMEVVVEVEPIRQAYTVVFDKNAQPNTSAISGTMENQVIDIDQNVQLSTNAFAREGYDFKGWNTKADGSGTSYTNQQVVNNLVTKGETVTLYAQWQTYNYTVKFDGNGATNGSMNDQVFSFDQEATALASNTFSRDYYTFAGWSTSKDGAVVYQNEQHISNLTNVKDGIVNLYAIWTKDPMIYTISATDFELKRSQLAGFDAKQAIALAKATATADGQVYNNIIVDEEQLSTIKNNNMFANTLPLKFSVKDDTSKNITINVNLTDDRVINANNVSVLISKLPTLTNEEMFKLANVSVDQDTDNNQLMVSGLDNAIAANKPGVYPVTFTIANSNVSKQIKLTVIDEKYEIKANNISINYSQLPTITQQDIIKASGAQLLMNGVVLPTPVAVTDSSLIALQNITTFEATKTVDLEVPGKANASITVNVTDDRKISAQNVKCDIDDIKTLSQEQLLTLSKATVDPQMVTNNLTIVNMADINKVTITGDYQVIIALANNPSNKITVNLTVYDDNYQLDATSFVVNTNDASQLEDTKVINLAKANIVNNYYNDNIVVDQQQLATIKGAKIGVYPLTFSLTKDKSMIKEVNVTVTDENSCTITDNVLICGNNSSVNQSELSNFDEQQFKELAQPQAYDMLTRDQLQVNVNQDNIASVKAMQLDSVEISASTNNPLRAIAAERSAKRNVAINIINDIKPNVVPQGKPQQPTQQSMPKPTPTSVATATISIAGGLVVVITIALMLLKSKQKQSTIN